MLPHWAIKNRTAHVTVLVPLNFKQIIIGPWGANVNWTVRLLYRCAALLRHSNHDPNIAAIALQLPNALPHVDHRGPKQQQQYYLNIINRSLSSSGDSKQNHLPWIIMAMKCPLKLHFAVNFVVPACWTFPPNSVKWIWSPRFAKLTGFVSSYSQSCHPPSSVATSTHRDWWWWWLLRSGCTAVVPA